MVKSKVRFDGLDVAAMVAHWNKVALGRRVINIYNGTNGDTYLFKLDKQSPSEKGNLLLLIESGIRFHSTQQPFENPGMPSPFCAKLRKHLRGLRLELVQQLGNKDRVVNLVFGSGDKQRHSLILEFYARGNIILADSNYTILSLLRSHEYEQQSSAQNSNNDKNDDKNSDNNKKNDTKNDNVKVKVGHAYPVTYATTLDASAMATTTATTEEGDNTDSKQNETLLSCGNPMEWYKNQAASAAPEAATNNNKKKKKENPNGAWKSLLMKPDSGVAHYGPSLIDHCMACTADIDFKNVSPPDLDESGWKALQLTLQTEGERILSQLDAITDKKGYILYQPKQKKVDETKTDAEKDNEGSPNAPPSEFEDKLLIEFQPHLLQQHEGIPFIEYPSFDEAVDSFFSHIEGQKLLLRAETQQAQAEQKLAKVRHDQQQRIDSLLEQQEILKKEAELVALHADMVEKAIQVVNSALDSGMDWEQLEDLVRVEQIQNRNPVALLIHKLELEQDAMILRLKTEEAIFNNGDEEDEEGDEEGTEKKDDDGTRKIRVSLKDTAHGNASALFAKYRASKEKSQKTLEASTKALQAAEETAQRQLEDAKKRKTHVTLGFKRKALWFEKFHWFVTSDNYLVIAGRDAQQNEQIVKRYLRPGDAYLHADVHGAASCVLRAKRRRKDDGKSKNGQGKTVTLPLSDQALREAGNFTICRSSAWNSRMVTSAWWVESHQVSKTAPTGEYLTVGSFMIRGKKNFLPPTQLEMGLGVLFRLGDDESIARHKNERRDFALMQLEQIEAEEEEEEDDGAFEEKPVANLASARKQAKENELPPLTEENEAPSPSSINEEKKEGSGSGISQDSNSDEENKDNAEGDDGDNSAAQDENGNGDNEEDEKVEGANSSKQKKGLSVKERKLIRKYGSLEAAQAAEEERLRAEQQKQSGPASKGKSNEQDTSSSGKRGKKTKLKRAAKKYADQDEEDKELALLALHAGEKSKKTSNRKAPIINETEKEAAAQTVAILKRDPAIVAEALPEKVKETLAKCISVKSSNDPDDDVMVRWDKFDADVLEQLETLELEEEKVAAAQRLLTLKESTRIDNFSASLAGIIRTIKKYGHGGLETASNGDNKDGKRKTKAEKQAEEESWKQTLAEEGVVDDDLEDDAVDDTIELSKLTGKPSNDDLILFAVPVCAPYQTLSQYTYRVKLTPGNVKRGKASKQCVELFLKDGQKSALADRTKELIKKAADNEWVQAICGDVKISASGASKVIQKQKAKNKSKKKK